MENYWVYSKLGAELAVYFRDNFKILYTVFFPRAGNFRVFCGFSENRENIQPGKFISAKKNLREKKGQTKITFRKRTKIRIFLLNMFDCVLEPW